MINWLVSDLQVILRWRLVIKVLVFVDIKYGGLQEDQASTGSVFPELAGVQKRVCRKAARVWPSRRAGRLTVGGPSRRAADRQARKKCFEVATHPQPSETVTDRNSSESGFFIFLIESPPQRDEPQLRNLLFSFLFYFLSELSYFKRRGWGSQGWRKGKILTAWLWWRKKNKMSFSLPAKMPTQWKWKSVNSKDKCYHSSCPYIAHMVPGVGLHPNPLPERRKICLDVKLKLT